MSRYSLEFGSYYLRDERGEIGLMTDEVAIAYDEDASGCTLLKHGNPERVEEWINQARAKYMVAGHRDMAMGLKMISGKIPVDDLNRMLDMSGYLGAWLKRHAPSCTAEVDPREETNG